MKITNVETFLVEPRWLFVKISTNEDITGWGEALGDKAQTISAAIMELKKYLLGKDPTQIEHLWQVMYRGAFWRGGPILNSAISGVEIALWDILGKSLNVPIYMLLGGKCRNKIRIYANIGEGESGKERKMKYGYSEMEWIELIEKKEITAIKFGPFSKMRPLEGIGTIKKGVNKVKEIREKIGYDIDLLLDFHGRMSPALAIVAIEEIAEYKPFFIEEPCLPENIDGLANIINKVNVPIATGERLFTKFSFFQLLEKCDVAVIQPDLSICGGIMEGKKIAAMAEAKYVGIAPHNPYGPILTAASLQLDTCTPNFLIQEYCSLGEGILKEHFEIKDGYVYVSEKPGLGIEVDEEAILKRPYKPKDLPMLYHDDGSMADW